MDRPEVRASAATLVFDAQEGARRRGVVEEALRRFCELEHLARTFPADQVVAELFARALYNNLASPADRLVRATWDISLPILRALAARHPQSATCRGALCRSLVFAYSMTRVMRRGSPSAYASEIRTLAEHYPDEADIKLCVSVIAIQERWDASVDSRPKGG
jgi:hypothetical protein